MASLAKPILTPSESVHHSEVDRLTEEVFGLFEHELASVGSEKKAAIIANVHITAESLRAKP